MFKRYVPAAAGIVYAAAILLSAPIASAEGDRVTPVFAKRLPNVPGKNLTAVVVFYPPGGKSVSHHHAGSVLAYVLSGAIRSQNSATVPSRFSGSVRPSSSHPEAPTSSARMQAILSRLACSRCSWPITAQF